MADSKVRQFIQSLGAPDLTAEEIAIVKAHHEYHGDKQIKNCRRIAAQSRIRKSH